MDSRHVDSQCAQNGHMLVDERLRLKLDRAEILLTSFGGLAVLTRLLALCRQGFPYEPRHLLRRTLAPRVRKKAQFRNARNRKRAARHGTGDKSEVASQSLLFGNEAIEP